MRGWSEKKLTEELQRVSQTIVPTTEEEKEYVFLLCILIAERHTKRCKYCNNLQEAQEFAVVVAEELYIHIVHDRYTIHHISSYIDHLLPEFCRTWMRLRGVRTPYLDNQESYYDPEQTKRIALPVTEQLMDNLYTRDALKKSWDALHKYIRYYGKWENKVASRNAHLSIVLSIRRNKFVNFHLNDRDARICRLLFNRYRLMMYDILVSAGKDVLSDNEYLSSAMQAIFEINGMGEDR